MSNDLPLPTQIEPAFSHHRLVSFKDLIKNIPDSTRFSRSGVDTRLGVLQLGRLFAKDD